MQSDHKMRVARLYNFYDIRIEEHSVPVPDRGEALIKTKASGICSGDVMRWYIENKAPLVLGHEPSGVVVEVGDGVSAFKPEDRVFVHHHAPCMRCRYCRRGDYVQCAEWKKPGISPGGISEYILILANTLENDTLLLPDSVSFEEGMLIEPLACVIKGLKRTRIRKGDTVLVIGLGFMGVLNALVAKRFGSERVIGAERVPYRIQKARALGIEVIDVSKSPLMETLSEITSGSMAEIVIVAPSSIDALKEGLSFVAPGGTLLMFSPVEPLSELALKPNQLYFKDISIVTSYSCGPADTADALELIEKKAIPSGELITHRFPIEETEKAYRITEEARDSLKCAILFD